MPIYEYQCAKCGKTIEVIQKMSDKPLKKHEQCGGTLTKLISQSGFQFKGTGWYVTDYARKSSGEGKEASESKEASTDKKTESKETSSNGSKEGSSGSASAAKSEGGKGKAEKSSSSKSSSKKD